MTDLRPIEGNYVSAGPEVMRAPRSDLVRRQDVIDQVAGLVDIYRQQQATALEAVHADATRNGYLSTAEQVRERRKLTRLYLLTYASVSALTVGGLAYLAMLAGVDGALSVAGWMAGTGALTLVLTWIRHGDEFRHSPEGIARHVVDAHWSLSEYEAETRRKAIAWEHHAEARRQMAATQSAADARQATLLRMQELEARRKAVEGQRLSDTPLCEGCHSVGHQAPIEGTPAASAAAPVSCDLSTNIDDHSAASAATVDTDWRTFLIIWISSLYEPGATNEGGVIKGRVPWAQRSNWPALEKAAAQRACCRQRPALIVAADGGRWRLRKELFNDAEQALHILMPRLSGTD